MIFVRTLVQEKIGLNIDQPQALRETTSTGNVTRSAFNQFISGFFIIGCCGFQRTALKIAHTSRCHSVTNSILIGG